MAVEVVVRVALEGEVAVVAVAVTGKWRGQGGKRGRRLKQQHASRSRETVGIMTTESLIRHVKKACKYPVCTEGNAPLGIELERFRTEGKKGKTKEK